MPEDYFEDLPFVPMAETEDVVVARTENPLLVEQQARVATAAEGRGKTIAKRGKTVKGKPVKGKSTVAVKKGKPAGDEKKAYVPPPPKDGAKIPVPAGVPKVKTFPISSGPQPSMMSITGIDVAQKEAAPEGAEGQDAAPEAVAVDDGFSPEEKRKMKLEEDPGFKSYLMMKRMKIPLINIRMKIKDENKGYTIEDINLFADKEEIESADFMLMK